VAVVEVVVRMPDGVRLVVRQEVPVDTARRLWSDLTSARKPG